MKTTDEIREDIRAAARSYDLEQDRLRQPESAPIAPQKAEKVLVQFNDYPKFQDEQHLLRLKRTGIRNVRAVGRKWIGITEIPTGPWLPNSPKPTALHVVTGELSKPYFEEWKSFDRRMPVDSFDAAIAIVKSWDGVQVLGQPIGDH